MNEVKADLGSKGAEISGSQNEPSKFSSQSKTLEDLNNELSAGKPKSFVASELSKNASGLLKASRFSVDELSETQRLEMWNLYSAFYEGAGYDSFKSDLSEKTHVIVCTDSGNGTIQGFTTVRIYEHLFQGTKTIVLYSGDTIVHPSYWGQKTFHFAFFRLLLHLRLTNPTKRIFWYLLCNGFKTYLVFSRNTPVHWPRFEKPTPAWEKGFIDSLSSSRFGDSYDSQTGIVAFMNSLGKLRSNVAPIGKEELKHPDIRFLVERNPGYINGDELCCIAEINLHMFFFFPIKVVKKFSKSVLALFSARTPKIALKTGDGE